MDAVLFSDGELVESGSGNIDFDFALTIFTQQRDAAVGIAETLLQGKTDPTKHDVAWEALEHAWAGRHSKGQKPSLSAYAYALLETKRLHGEAAAYEVAEYMLTVSKPWRSKR